MKWIQNLIIKYRLWKLKYKYKHMHLTPQGQYFIKYILDYYINEITNEPIDRYENQITQFSKRITLPPTANPIPDILKPALLHYHAAIIMFRTFLMACDNKQEWLDNIQDEEIKKMISNPLQII